MRKCIVRTVHERARVPWTHWCVRRMKQSFLRLAKAPAVTLFPVEGAQEWCHPPLNPESTTVHPYTHSHATHTHTLYLDPLLKPQYLLSLFSNLIPPFSESNSKKTKTLHPHEVLDKHSSFPVFLFYFFLRLVLSVSARFCYVFFPPKHSFLSIYQGSPCQKKQQVQKVNSSFL